MQYACNEYLDSGLSISLLLRELSFLHPKVIIDHTFHDLIPSAGMFNPYGLDPDIVSCPELLIIKI